MGIQPCELSSDAATRRCEFDCVGNEIPNNLLQTCGITRDQPGCCINRNGEFDSFRRGGRMQSVNRSVNDWRQVYLRCSILSLPVMIRETSRMSSMIDACERALRSMTLRALALVSASISPRLSIADQPRIALKGVRNSWETVAKNSSLRRSAASASLRASRSLSSRASRSCSMRRRSLVS